MKRWIISDTHFGHTNIIKYCDRPFTSTEEMDRELIKVWNSLIKQDDVVWHLGDFALGNKDKVGAILEQLNGRIHLVLGNHDRCPYKWYKDNFYKVYDRPVVIEGNIILSHAPIGNVTTQFHNLFGHVHNNSHNSGLDQYGNFNCCVENNNYRPVNLDELVQAIRKNQKLFSV